MWDRTLNEEISTLLGHDVVLVDAIPLRVGQVVTLTIEQAKPSPRQGVSLGTEGMLQIGERKKPQLIVWADETPLVAEVVCEATDGLLRVYNVWEPRDGSPGFESRLRPSGMIVEELDDGSRRYACNDIEFDNPDFQTLVFRLSIS